MLAGKVAVVTGGARGIGRAIVELLLARAATVSFLDVDAEQGRAVADELSNGTLRFVHCDVTSEAQVSRAMSDTARRFGGVDLLVNNAGVNAYFDATTMTEAEWEQVFAVDLKGMWLCAKHVLPLMQKRGGGSIVNIASIHALMTSRGMFPYAAAKAGVVGLTRSLALDYGEDQIRVNAVCPGVVRTQLLNDLLERQPDPVAAEREMLRLNPLGRIGTPVEIANLVAFLCSDEASFISGAALSIDGGLSARFAS